jgi:hypothetical protein
MYKKEEYFSQLPLILKRVNRNENGKMATIKKEN